MGTPAAVILATVNRLGARLGHGLADVAAELAILAQDAPDRIRQEWDRGDDILILGPLGSGAGYGFSLWFGRF